MPICPMPEQIERAIDIDTLQRAIAARWELMTRTGEKLIQENRERTARALLASGLTLIPSDHLLDHQFCVSRGVYDAALKFERVK